MPDFTPGPWKAVYDAGAYVVFKEGSGDGVAIMYGDYSEREGNAYLVAAAPEMYEALCEVKDILKLFRGIFPQESKIGETLRKVEATLVKAEGKQKTGD